MSGVGHGVLVPKHEAQHRAYLQRLQERNQAFRQQKGNDDKFLDKLRREQGFSVCFSGANASKGGVPSRNKPSKGHSRGGSPWRQWEEGTVEIKGLRGEVYAVRPTGERVATKAPGLNFCKDALPSWAATQKVDEGVLQASEESQLNLDATGQDLVFLRQQLSKDAGLDDETGIPDDKVEDLSDEVPIPSDLTERVARLPNHWRRALMDLLEEAEALQEKMTCDTCDEDLLHTPVDEGNEALTEDVLGIDEPDEIGEICEVDRKLDPDSEKEDEQLEADSEPIRSTSSGGNPAPSKSQCSVPSQEPVGCSQGSQGSQDRQAEVSAETPDGEDVTATSRARESPATVGKDLVAAGGGAAAVRVVRAAEKPRTDRNCPEYHDNYEDENTFYAGAGSNTSGGSSGSPVIARSGNCIALNAGGAHEAASAFFLPLDRAVYVLEWLKSHPNEIPLPPRGSLLARWLFQPFDMLRRLGFTAEQEAEVLALSPDASVNDRQKGLLVVENVIRGTEAEQKLKPGDVLLEVAGKPCLNFVILEEQLDTAVDHEVNIKLSRAGEVMNIHLRVVDFHKLISHDFVECGGGVFHVLSYHTCKTYNIPILDRGIYVSQSGFSFGLQIPVSAVITSVAQKKVTSLTDFEQALAGVPNKEMFEVRWFNPSANEHRQKCSMIRMERTLWPARVWDFCPKRPNTWKRRSWVDEGMKEMAKTASAPEPVECSPVSDSRSRASAEQDSDTVPAALREEDSFGYPENSDAAISMVQPMLCTIVTQVSHEYATDFLQSKEENKSTVIRRFGVGLVIDSVSGLVLTDRYTVPQPLVEVELTFGQTVTVNATCLFMHPHHNMVLLHYDPLAVKDLPVRAIDLGDVSPKTEELSAGQVLSFVSIHSDHQLSAKQVTVGSMCLKVWPFPQPPAYRGRNLEICNLNDTLHGLGGLLIEPAPSYRIRAWFAQFPAGSLRYLAGVPVQVFAAVLSSLGLESKWAERVARPLDPALAVAALECEFEEVSLAKARREDGVPLENARALAACSSGGRRQILRVGRIMSGGGCDGILLEGDLVLSINGKPVTKPHEIEREMRKCHTCDGEESVSSMRWRVQRSRQPMDLDLTPTLLHSDGTEHIVVFNGVVLRLTPRAVAERGGPTLPFTRPGQGLYFWYIYPGSPADTFSFADSRAMRNLGWLVQLNNEPTPSIDRLLEIIHSGALSGCEWLRCHVMDAEGRLSVRALRPDFEFWPTVEIVRRKSQGQETYQAPTWERVEHMA